MILNKWNYQKHKYEPYEIPDDWNIGGDIPLDNVNLNSKCNCAGCGKIHTLGDMYSSVEIQNELGLGYAVCEKCHHKEMLRKFGQI